MYMAGLVAAKLPPMRPPAPDDEDLRIATAVKFSQQQRAVMCALRVPHFVNTGRLRARRAALSAQLQVRIRDVIPGTAVAARPRLASRRAGSVPSQAGAHGPPPGYALYICIYALYICTHV
jgi:hypothetical protein